MTSIQAGVGNTVTSATTTPKSSDSTSSTASGSGINTHTLAGNRTGCVGGAGERPA